MPKSFNLYTSPKICIFCTLATHMQQTHGRLGSHLVNVMCIFCTSAIQMQQTSNNYWHGQLLNQTYESCTEQWNSNLFGRKHHSWMLLPNIIMLQLWHCSNKAYHNAHALTTDWQVSVTVLNFCHETSNDFPFCGCQRTLHNSMWMVSKHCTLNIVTMWSWHYFLELQKSGIFCKYR